MKVTEAKYVKRINLSNYEHEEISLTSALDEDDVAAQVIEELKAIVCSGAPAAAPEELPEKSPKGKGKKAKKEEEVVPEVAEEEEQATEETEEEVVEEEEEEKPAPKKGKKKGSPYSRANETHKVLFTETLKEINPKWNKSDAGKAKAKKASMEMDGEDFLDAEGEILPSFVKNLKAKMK